jgi:LAS superfamily LD-carboxypeptidase LdcB
MMPNRTRPRRPRRPVDDPSTRRRVPARHRMRTTLAVVLSAALLSAVVLPARAQSPEPAPAPAVDTAGDVTVDPAATPENDRVAYREAVELLRRTEADAVRLEADRNANMAKLDELEATIADLRADRERSSAYLDEAKQRLARASIDTYKYGSATVEGIALAADSRSIDEFDLAMRYLRKVQDRTGSAVRTFRQNLDAQSRSAARLDAALAQQRDLEGRLAADKERLEAAVDAQQLVIEQLRDRLDAAELERLTSLAAATRQPRLPPPPELAVYGNGRIPAQLLQELGFGFGRHRLWPAAARAFQNLYVAALADGVTIGVTDSYRSYEGQVDVALRKGLYKNGGLAATPGTSNHGWGLAVDLKLTPAALAWMRANGPRFGYFEDVPRESWHWQFRWPQFAASYPPGSEPTGVAVGPVLGGGLGRDSGLPGAETLPDPATVDRNGNS